MRNFEQVKRIVIKIGTSTLSTDDGINRDYIQSLAQQVRSYGWSSQAGKS
jgi:glutamate 5-kinase